MSLKDIIEQNARTKTTYEEVVNEIASIYWLSYINNYYEDLTYRC